MRVPSFRAVVCCPRNGHCSQRFLGMEVAEKQDDEAWVLLPDTLDLSRQTDNFEAVRRGRDFLRDYDGEGRMFEPLWQDREQ